jgi:MYXO-CTERM domain-containing protein
MAPLYHDDALGRAARFHTAEMAAQSYFGHDSACTVVADIAARYPGTCDGAAACACAGGMKACSPNCTTWSARVKLFGPTATGEIVAGSADPNSAFYQWLYESFGQATCAYVQGPPTNGHRWNILKKQGSVGYGVGGRAVGDFSGKAGSYKIPSGAHYPRQAAAVEVWANFYDGAAPQAALVDVDGSCRPLARRRGSGGNAAYAATLSDVASGCHRYFFVFKDATGAQVTYPTSGSLGIGPAATCPDLEDTRPPLGAGCDCTPSCAGKACGDNGCGGSCGACGAGQHCQADQCVDGPAPDGGTGGSGGAGGAGGNPPGPPPADPAGCACSLGARDPAPLGLLAGLLGLALFLLHRRITRPPRA